MWTFVLVEITSSAVQLQNITIFWLLWLYGWEGKGTFKSKILIGLAATGKRNENKGSQVV